MCEWLDTNEYAERFKLHPQHVRDLCASGEIEAEKIGSVWRIPYTEPASVRAEERVQEIVNQTIGPCVAVVDAGIEALLALKEKLLKEGEAGV